MFPSDTTSTSSGEVKHFALAEVGYFRGQIMMVEGNLQQVKYIDLAKPKSGAPGLFIFTGCRISENKRLWNCPPLGFPGFSLIM